MVLCTFFDSGLNCQASTTEIEPFLVLINLTVIIRVSIDGTNYQTIATGLSSGAALDYDYNNDMIYWTDIKNGEIRATPLSNGHIQSIIVSGIAQ